MRFQHPLLQLPHKYSLSISTLCKIVHHCGVIFPIIYAISICILIRIGTTSFSNYWSVRHHHYHCLHLLDLYRKHQPPHPPSSVQIPFGIFQIRDIRTPLLSFRFPEWCLYSYHVSALSSISWV